MKIVYALVNVSEDNIELTCIYPRRIEAEHMMQINLKEDASQKFTIVQTLLAEKGDVQI